MSIFNAQVEFSTRREYQWPAHPLCPVAARAQQLLEQLQNQLSPTHWQSWHSRAENALKAEEAKMPMSLTERHAWWLLRAQVELASLGSAP